jgi:hypothetical protein
VKFLIQLEKVSDQIHFTFKFGFFVLLFMAAMLAGIGINQGDEGFAYHWCYSVLAVLVYWSFTFAGLFLLIDGILFSVHAIADIRARNNTQ